jgi:hypothetical protein
MKEKFPMAAEAVQDYMYMDDVLKSFETPQEVIELINQVQPLLLGCDMVIQKFYSNCKEALSTLPPERLSKKVHFQEKDAILEASKVLGMVWDAEKDDYNFIAKYDSPEAFFDKQNLPEAPGWTKRGILRLSATVFDPIGLLAPFTIQARSLIQRLFSENLGWDDPIPEPFLAEWNKWLTCLFTLAKHVKIPRWIGLRKDREFTIHVFADASTKAFAACAYVRVVDTVVSRREKTWIDVSLVAGKARVTPKKTESVSRLELAACVIATRLGCSVARAYGVSIKEIHYWTDSMNCLFWINSNASSLKTFVSNRVGEIHTCSEAIQWRHVPTDQNPADIPTRFLKVEELASNQLWWKGPSFLREREENWPKAFTPPEKTSDECKEEFKKKLFIAKAQESPPRPSVLGLGRYSCGAMWDGYQKLRHNFTLVCSLSRPQRTHADNAQTGFNMMIRRAQQVDHITRETIRLLQEDKHSEVAQSMRPFLPYVDKEGLLRSKSRLAQVSYLPFETKFPIILSGTTSFAKLLVSSYHYRFEHAVGQQMAKYQVKTKFEVVGLENLLRSIRKDCMICKREKTKPLKQRIGDIPEFRFERPLKAFAKVGLDFAGPFEIKQTTGRGRLKAYILVLTCLQTRALHLEATVGMDTSAFMNAISRFISLRDIPVDIYSDNFKTFVSHDKELQNWVRSLEIDNIIQQHKAQVSWTFTPPKAAHFGGIYEIMVKASKRCLKAIQNHGVLNQDQFYTVVYHVASTLNSRPLTRVKQDGSETMTITPNHFLHGSLGGAVSTALEDNPKERWHEVVKVVNSTWKLYLEEYLLELRRAHIWQDIMPNVRVGDLVLELDKNLPRGLWKMAKIVTLLRSKDGLIRKVRILRNGTEYIRALAQLCPLDVNLEVNPEMPIRDEAPEDKEVDDL